MQTNAETIGEIDGRAAVVLISHLVRSQPRRQTTWETPTARLARDADRLAHAVDRMLSLPSLGDYVRGAERLHRAARRVFRMVLTEHGLMVEPALAPSRRDLDLAIHEAATSFHALGRRFQCNGECDWHVKLAWSNVHDAFAALSADIGKAVDTTPSAKQLVKHTPSVTRWSCH